MKYDFDFSLRSPSKEMDHLPRPHRPLHDNMEIPCWVMDGLEYDGQGIEGYASRRGFDRTALRQGDLHGHSIEETLSFLQSWLFFGLVFDVFGCLGIRLLPQDFIRSSSDGSHVITTLIFPDLMIVWETIERTATDAGKKKRLNRIEACLSYVEDFVTSARDALWDHDLSGDGATRNDELRLSCGSVLRLSILLLGETLCSGRIMVYQNRMERESSFLAEGALGLWDKHPMFDRILLNSGWCPFEVQTWRSRGSNSLAWYISNIPGTRESEDHTRCTRLDCQFNEIDRDTYVTRHLTESCPCVHLYSVLPPNSEDADVLGESVSTILQRGHIPLLTISGPSGGEALTIISSEKPGLPALIGYKFNKKIWSPNYSTWLVNNNQAKPRVRYVAISHVWRGGLGNPRQNSLPRCQLARIQTLVNRLYAENLHPVPFWIDTLCVPLEASLRSLAIRQMKSIYLEADMVLVLDSSLQEIPLPPDPVESLLRIACSTWMQRLWTFQEGILAFQLIFQFHDACVSGEDLIKQQETRDRDFYNAHIQGVTDLLKERYSDTWLMRFRNAADILRSHPSSVDHPWTGRGGGHPNAHNLVTKFAKRSFKSIRIPNSFHTHTLKHVDRAHDIMAKINGSLEWRRTSRMEDEVLVLANLLSLDITKLTDARAELTMKFVLHNMDLVPKDLLFVPREHFRDPGCSWMPLSLIDGGSESHLTNKQASVTQKGLKLSSPGLLLTSDSVLTLSSHYLTQVNGFYFSVYVRYLQPNTTDEIDEDQDRQREYALLLRNEPNRHATVRGALLSNVHIAQKIIHGRWSGVVTLSPIPAISDESPTQMIHVSAELGLRQWCVN